MVVREAEEPYLAVEQLRLPRERLGEQSNTDIVSETPPPPNCSNAKVERTAIVIRCLFIPICPGKNQQRAVESRN